MDANNYFKDYSLAPLRIIYAVYTMAEDMAGDIAGHRVASYMYIYNKDLLRLNFESSRSQSGLKK